MASIARSYILDKKRQQQAGNQRCQKCLQIGHWTYECTNKRKYLQRDSRTAVIKKKIKLMKSEKANTDSTNSEVIETENKTTNKRKGSGKSEDESDESDESSTTDSSNESNSSEESSNSSSDNSSSSSSSGESSSDHESDSSDDDKPVKKRKKKSR
ncbi:unnamed protein product [Porites lobata]|uniref:Zinc finger CCHC domain-containing protein 10 n=1 Tax=Porites lobata TaxID=104759 RepID=A0ABN8N137_9CNID|nr:unnamed protein product [Porites lobata]